jgi:guanylate kinase
LARGNDRIPGNRLAGRPAGPALVPDCIGIFILPPSLEEPERRMRIRGQDSEAVTGVRSPTREELRHSSEFEYAIINKDFDEAKPAPRRSAPSAHARR